MSMVKARGIHWLTLGCRGLFALTLPLSGAPSAPGATAKATGWVTPVPPYPVAARPLREQGRGALFVRTGADGRVVEARMEPSTGSRVLDEAAVAFARTHWRGPANQSQVKVLDFSLSSTLPPRPGASIASPTPPATASSGPPFSHDGKVHLLVNVGPAGRAERIRVTASLGPQLDRAAVAKVRAGYVGTPMSVQSLTFSP